MKTTIFPSTPHYNNVDLPGDKSLGHRLLMASFLKPMKYNLEIPLAGRDIISTANCIKKLGVRISYKDGIFMVDSSKGVFPAHNTCINCGNSGTTMRLLPGLLSMFDKRILFDGDASLRKRPMGRILNPLIELGVKVEYLEKSGFAPFTILGPIQKKIYYTLPVASAQVKSCLLFAGLNNPPAFISEPGYSRRHTENLLAYLGAKIEVKEKQIWIYEGSALKSALPKTIKTPLDPSAAFFMIALAFLHKNLSLDFERVLKSPGRDGFVKILKPFGLEVEEQDPWLFEELQTLKVSENTIWPGAIVNENDVPGMIDELVMLAFMAPFGSGLTKISGAKELRIKETDRIKASCTLLEALGAKVHELEDGLSVPGNQILKGGVSVPCYGDHRIAMALAVAATKCQEPVTIEGSEAVDISYPSFFKQLQNLGIHLEYSEN